jgi:hypothetical protein
MCLGREGALIVASEDVQGNPGNEVGLRIKADVISTSALVLTRDGAVLR